MNIKTKRVYEESAPSDGVRILVDRLWPQGLSKEKAHLDFWAKDVAPTNDLRHWYDHDVKKWEEFKKKYIKELNNNSEAVAELKTHLHGHVITFLFAAKVEEFNNAEVLREYMNDHEKR